MSSSPISRLPKPRAVPCKLLTPEEIAEVHPLLNQSPDIRGGILHTEDGYVNPADITQAMAKLARDAGAKVYQNTEAQSYEKLTTAIGRWPPTRARSPAST